MLGFKLKNVNKRSPFSELWETSNALWANATGVNFHNFSKDIDSPIAETRDGRLLKSLAVFMTDFHEDAHILESPIWVWNQALTCFSEAIKTVCCPGFWSRNCWPYLHFVELVSCFSKIIWVELKTRLTINLTLVALNMLLGNAKYTFLFFVIHQHWISVLRLPGSNPAFSKGRQLVSFRFEYRLPAPEHRN